MSQVRGLVMFGTVLCLLFTNVGCQQKAPVDTRAQDEKAIRDADAAALRAVQAKNADGVASNYADDASWLPPNAPAVSGKEAIRGEWAKLVNSGGFDMSWQISKVEVSRGGDLAYSTYTYQVTSPGADGRLTSDHGKALVVWKKQTDGAWKIAADTFNSDQPIAGPAKAPPAKRQPAKRSAKKKRRSR